MFSPYKSYRFYPDYKKERIFKRELYTISKFSLGYTGRTLIDYSQVIKDLSNIIKSKDFQKLDNFNVNKYVYYSSYILEYIIGSSINVYNFQNESKFGISFWFSHFLTGSKFLKFKINTKEKISDKFIPNSFIVKPYVSILGVNEVIYDENKNTIYLDYKTEIKSLTKDTKSFSLYFQDKIENKEIKEIVYGKFRFPIPFYSETTLVSIPLITDNEVFNYLSKIDREKALLFYDLVSNKTTLIYPFNYKLTKDCFKEFKNNEDIYKLIIEDKLKVYNKRYYIWKLGFIYSVNKKKSIYNPHIVNLPLSPTFLGGNLIALMTTISINSIYQSLILKNICSNIDILTYQSSNRYVYNHISNNNTILVIPNVYIFLYTTGWRSPFHLFFSLTKNNTLKNNIFALPFVYVKIENRDKSKVLSETYISEQLFQNDDNELDISQYSDKFVIEYINDFNIEPHTLIDFPLYLKPKVNKVKKNERDLTIPTDITLILGLLSKDFSLTSNYNENDENIQIIDKPLNDITLQNNNNNTQNNVSENTRFLFKYAKNDIISLDKIITNNDYKVLKEFHNHIPIALHTQSFTNILNEIIEEIYRVNNERINSTIQKDFNLYFFVSLIDCEKIKSIKFETYVNDDLLTYLNLCEMMLSSFYNSRFCIYRYSDDTNIYRSRVLHYLLSEKFDEFGDNLITHKIYRIKLRVRIYLNISNLKRFFNYKREHERFKIFYYNFLNQVFVINKNTNKIVDRFNIVEKIEFSYIENSLKEIYTFTTKYPIYNVNLEKQDNIEMILPDWKKLKIKVINQNNESDDFTLNITEEDLLDFSNMNTNEEGEFTNRLNEIKEKLKKEYPLLWIPYYENDDIV